MRVIVTGLIASYPLGGLAWHYLHYVLGLRSMGCDVYYLEDTGNWMYDPVQQTFTDQIDNNLKWLSGMFQRFDLANRWAVRGPDGRMHGKSEAVLLDLVQSADVLLNVSGSCWLRQEYLPARRKIYIDTDPGYNQIRANKFLCGSDDKDLCYSIERMAMHDAHYTFGLNARSADCTLPETQFEWIPTRQPIAMAHVPIQPISPASVYTTVMSWNAYAKPVEFNGVSYQGKESRLERVLKLPKRCAGATFELAISGQAPTEQLTTAGWRVRSAADVSDQPEAFRDYISQSRGEFSVAKDLYVQMRTGWFGDRSAAYLAAGRPAILEDTGFSNHLPTGQGLLAFDDLATAAMCIRTVEADYDRHTRAARDVAESQFAAPVVLKPLLDI